MLPLSSSQQSLSACTATAWVHVAAGTFSLPLCNNLDIVCKQCKSQLLVVRYVPKLANTMWWLLSHATTEMVTRAHTASDDRCSGTVSGCYRHVWLDEILDVRLTNKNLTTKWNASLKTFLTWEVHHSKLRDLIQTFHTQLIQLTQKMFVSFSCRNCLMISHQVKKTMFWLCCLCLSM